MQALFSKWKRAERLGAVSYIGINPDILQSRSFLFFGQGFRSLYYDDAY
jgi:hypothetical protein